MTEIVDTNSKREYTTTMKTYEIHYHDEHNHLKTAIITASTLHSALNMFVQMYEHCEAVGANEKES